MFTALTPTQKLAKTQQEQFALGQAEAVDQSHDEETECHDKLFSCPEEGRVDFRLSNTILILDDTATL